MTLSVKEFENELVIIIANVCVEVCDLMLAFDSTE
jgi:hypothetical protein